MQLDVVMTTTLLGPKIRSNDFISYYKTILVETA